MKEWLILFPALGPVLGLLVTLGIALLKWAWPKGLRIKSQFKVKHKKH